ncbi:MAG: alpha/beta fold hydrolase [Ignavibacteriales bacterium]|nr:MAG: alpha/beta fold hydrolase [Ignavibacteriaceae bacterium]MBW7872233.1 alpha/beta fold hydrolase [Ignavibacteria bacterium]MCZ2144046.1 alpha/beta fold hydrolase [Ignavibacteriales bacterium]OQY75923.1 MAG: hypothetical protein B6D45_04875 [Ignavibacteriales bacterium UTCHB3]MBV6445620.1 Homoserine O-acetyltransferase [Ignavibacteriaceae bacterium]
MKKSLLLFLVLLVFAPFTHHTTFKNIASSNHIAPSKRFSVQQYYNLGELTLVSGEILKDTKVGFRTFGKMNAEKSNVVAYLSWYEGSSQEMIGLLGSNKFIDTNKYFTILVDALGNGVSTSPSNYVDKQHFPDISIEDMVNSQYQLLTKHFKLEKIHAIVGGSMGGMQVFQWMVSYPGFSKKYLPYVGTPVLSSVNKVMMESSKDILGAVAKYGLPDSVATKIYGMNFYLWSRTPHQYDSLYTPWKYQSLLGFVSGRTSDRMTTGNRIAQLNAMSHHDITRKFNGNLEAAAKSVVGEVFIIVSETDHLVLPYQSIQFAKYLKCGLLVLQNDCGHLGPNCEMERVSRAISEFLAE